MLTPEAYAALLGISTRQLQRLRAIGLPHLPVGARGVRYDPAVATPWLQANQGLIQECLTTATKPAATKSVSAAAVSAFTAACRRAQLRVTPSASNQS